MLGADKTKSFPTRIQFPATCVQIRLRDVQIASAHFTEVQDDFLVNGIHGNENKNEWNWREYGECVAVAIPLEWHVDKSGQLCKHPHYIELIDTSSIPLSFPTKHSPISRTTLLDNQTPLNIYQQLAFRSLLNSISSSYASPSQSSHVSRRGLTTHRCVAVNGFQSRLQLSTWTENRERILRRHLSRNRHFHM